MSGPFRTLGWNRAGTVWAAIGLVVLTGCGREPAFVAPPPPKVVVAQPVRQRVVVYAEAPARVDAAQSVDVLARVHGFVEEIAYTDGQLVEQDQLLFRIEPEEYDAAVKQAEASLASGEAALSLAETRLEKIKRAEAADAATPIEVVEAEANRDQAAAQVKSAEAALSQARLNLRYTEVVAPFAGRVSEAKVDIGDYVAGGSQSVLARVLALDPIFVYWDASERAVLDVRSRGQKLPRSDDGQAIPEDERIAVKLRLADGSVYDEGGYIDYVAPAIDPGTGTLRMRVRINNPDLLLLPGQFARVMIATFDGEAVVVPETALLRDEVGPYLLAIDQQNIVERRDVKLGSLVDEGRIVEQGITPEDRIVTVGIQRARPGLPVDPQSPPEAAAPQNPTRTGDGDQTSEEAETEASAEAPDA